jgi:hypothetical protein
MEHCYLHPKIETGLSCGLCERPICVDCAVHTKQGTKCVACLHGREVAPSMIKAAAPKSSFQDRYFNGVVITLLLAYLSPAALLFELIALCFYNQHRQVPKSRLFAFGVAIMFLLDMLILQLILTSPNFKHIKSLHQLHVSPFLAGISLLAAILSWNLVYKPARQISKYWSQEHYGTVAGMTVTAAVAMTLLSCVVSGVLFALL